MGNLENKCNIEVTNVELNGIRVDKLISDTVNNLTRSRVNKLINEQRITVNNKTVNKSYKVSVGDKISIIFPVVKEYDIQPENILLNIVYEDNDLLVINKPKNMVVHPANGNYTGTLVNALLYHCKNSLSGINGVARPGIVHRIDKNTSGLIVVAKNDKAHIGLSEQIKEHTFKRVYNAVVYGTLKNKNGIIDLPIGRSKKDRKKMCVTYSNSKPAKTIYETILDFQKFSYIKLILKTGRTHQIRVHMSYIGHPVAGDDVYGPKKVITKLNGQCLHAKTIGFIHPIKKIYMEFDSELPNYFKNFLIDCNNLILGPFLK